MKSLFIVLLVLLAVPCFAKNDLYTIELGKWTSDDLERRFFGIIDSRGRDAVEFFGDYKGLSNHVSSAAGKGVQEAYRALPEYMDAQRFRTPRGLDDLKASINVHNHSAMLLAMQQLFRFHTTM